MLPYDIYNLIMTYCTEPIYAYSANHWYVKSVNFEIPVTNPKSARSLLKIIRVYGTLYPKDIMCNRVIKDKYYGLFSNPNPKIIDLLRKEPLYINPDTMYFILTNKTTDPVSRKFLDEISNNWLRNNPGKFESYMPMFNPTIIKANIDRIINEFADSEEIYTLIQSVHSSEILDLLYMYLDRQKLSEIISGDSYFMDWLNEHPEYINIDLIFRNPSTEIFLMIFDIFGVCEYIPTNKTTNIYKCIKSKIAGGEKCPTRIAHWIFPRLKTANIFYVDDLSMYYDPAVLTQIYKAGYTNREKLNNFLNPPSHDEISDGYVVKYGTRLVKLVSREFF